MSCEKLYQRVLRLIGESEGNLTHVVRAVDAIAMLQAQWSHLLTEYAKKTETEVAPFVRSLGEESPFPDRLDAAATYAVASLLIEGDQPERARSLWERAQEEVRLATAEVPGKVHAITDVYA